MRPHPSLRAKRSDPRFRCPRSQISASLFCFRRKSWKQLLHYRLLEPLPDDPVESWIASPRSQ